MAEINPFKDGTEENSAEGENEPTSPMPREAESADVEDVDVEDDQDASDSGARDVAAGMAEAAKEAAAKATDGDTSQQTQQTAESDDSGGSAWLWVIGLLALGWFLLTGQDVQTNDGLDVL
jgi:hypothetical protein